jgi:hypothetical protein
MPATLTQTRIAQGWWEGRLEGAGDAPPAAEARHQDRPLPGLAAAAVPGAPGAWTLRLPIPADILSDGVQTVILTLDGAVLGQITLIAGLPPDEDLRAELALLRAELDLLKRAFRRHCAETAG